MSDRLVLSKSIHQFTAAERFSLTSMLTGKMKEWNLSTQHRFLGPLAARIVGVVSIVFAMAGDVIIHTGMFLGKSFVVLPAKPFTLCLEVPKDLDLSSPLVHLANAASRLSKIVVLPFISLLDPNRAHGAAEFEGVSLKEIQSLQAIIKDLNDKNAIQKMQLQSQHNSKEKLKVSTRIDSMIPPEGGMSNEEAYHNTPSFRHPNGIKDRYLKKEEELNGVRKKLDFNTPKKGAEGLGMTSHKRRNSFSGTPSKNQFSLPSEFLKSIREGIPLNRVMTKVCRPPSSAQKKVDTLSSIIDSLSLDLPTPTKSPGRANEFQFTPYQIRKIEPLDEQGISKDLESKLECLGSIKVPRIFNEFELFAQEMLKYFGSVSSSMAYLPNYENLWKENYAGQFYSLRVLAGSEVRVFEAKKKQVPEKEINTYVNTKKEFYQRFLEEVARLKSQGLTQSTKSATPASTYSYKFFSVESEARKYLAETNKIIHRIASEEHLEIDTLNDLMEEAQAIKAKISEESVFNPQHHRRFKEISKMIKALNNHYYRGKIFTDTDPKKQALRDLSLINIKTELEKNPMFTINALQLMRQVSNETIGSLDVLEKCLEEAEAGLVSDTEKLKSLRSILDLLNQGRVK